MKTLQLDFTIQGKDATAMIDFSDDAQKPIAAIQLRFNEHIAVGVCKVKHCLGDSYDSLIAHALTIKDGN